MQDTDHPVVSGTDLFEAIHSHTGLGRAVETVLVAIALDVVLDDIDRVRVEYWRSRLVTVVDLYRSQSAASAAALVTEIGAQL